MNELDIKTIRKKLGMTQTQFAEMIGVDVKTVQNWEYGRPIPATKYGIIRKIEESLSAPAETAPPGQVNEHGDNINGEHITVNKTEAYKLLDALGRQQEMTLKSQVQIDRLITLVERLSTVRLNLDD